MTSQPKPTGPGMSEQRWPASLNFEHTVPRGLVHRRNLSELFLTDSVRVGDGRFIAGAHLPAAHRYYTDHTAHSGAIDPLLLLECCRQAETHAAHEHFNVPMNTKFVLRAWTLVATTTTAPGPRDLVIDTRVANARWRDELLRRQQYLMTLIVDGEQAGEAWMDVDYIPGELYPAMRNRSRDGAPPWSDDVTTAAVADCVAPELVGRSQPDNVLLRSPRIRDAGIDAELRYHVQHPSLFDHAQDHVPGMVLMEAGRQQSLLAIEHCLGAAPEHVTVLGLDASFSSYTELDAPTIAHAHEVETGATADTCSVRISFLQHERTVADVTFTVRLNGDASPRVSAANEQGRA